MFVLSQRAQIPYRALALIVTAAFLLWSAGAYFSTAVAANLTNISDTLSDSDLGVPSDHTIEFTIPAGSAGVESGETITVEFPPSFNIATSGVLVSDVDLEVDGVDETVVAAAPAVGEWLFGTTTNTLTFTSGGAGATIGALATVTIKIGTVADGPGVNQVTNAPTAGSYEFTVTSGDGANNDTGQYQVAIIDDVIVTANVDTSFTFTVSGLPNGTTVNNSPTTTSTTTTATTLPFETLTEDVSKTLAQRLTVETNAINGYVVTVEQSQDLRSTTNADIDAFIDGAYTDNPTAWQDPAKSLLLENTWGHWGLTTTDGDLQGAGTDFTSADTWIAASTTPRAIMAHDGPSDGATGTGVSTSDDVGSTTVGYQIQITSLQEAADDYTTTLTYIATPTF